MEDVLAHGLPGLIPLADCGAARMVAVERLVRPRHSAGRWVWQLWARRYQSEPAHLLVDAAIVPASPTLFCATSATSWRLAPCHYHSIFTLVLTASRIRTSPIKELDIHQMAVDLNARSIVAYNFISCECSCSIIWWTAAGLFRQRYIHFNKIKGWENVLWDDSPHPQLIPTQVLLQSNRESWSILCVTHKYLY